MHIEEAVREPVSLWARASPKAEGFLKALSSCASRLPVKMLNSQRNLRKLGNDSFLREWCRSAGARAHP